MKSKETPTNGRKKYSHNKLGSQIGNVVRAKMKYNERNTIYNGCSLQSKQIITIKMIKILTSFSLFSSPFVFFI